MTFPPINLWSIPKQFTDYMLLQKNTYIKKNNITLKNKQLDHLQTILHNRNKI